MRLTLDVSKTLQQNAALYFEKAKRLRKKAAGARAAAERFRKILQELEQKQAVQQKEVRKKPAREKQWFEKFRWFTSSDGFLCIGGRDATTNEMLIKKYAMPGDLVFHTEMAGSPFFIVKAEGKPVPEQTIRETADATATFSRAWKLGLAAADVYWVKPEQVTKEARAGEYLTKGAFVIKGRTNRVPNTANLAIGITSDGLVMAG
ncbi:DUF814 domain-containing protein, partial [Candidatus Woesearchaeota archaeon]|nr:DUF814 domain-containing protein [Candidatus Woesearchaeota archaeon]